MALTSSEAASPLIRSFTTNLAIGLVN